MVSLKSSIKYADNVPKDYGISEMQYTFDFIYLVLKRNESIDGAIKGVAGEYALSYGYFNDYLIENKYILNKANADELSKQLKSYNTKSLKKILKEHGIKTSGKRERIEQRIVENKLIGIDYHLSSKSKVFYKNKKRRMRIFNEYLSENYYFNEFNEFYMDNYRKKEANIPIEFINLSINKSIEDKDHENYLSANRVMANHFLKKENFRKMLGYELKNYCININPVWKIDNLDGHVGLLKDTYDRLIFLQDKLSKNTVINTFYVIWDSFDFDRIIVSKYDAYRYLKDIFHLKGYDKINDDLNSRFYLNQDLKIKKITQKTLFDF